MNAEDRFDSLFRYYAEQHSIDWLLLKAMAWQESRFNPDAVSPVGAKGLMQFMDRTWLEWRDGTLGIQDLPPRMHVNPYDPEDAIRAAAAMLAWLNRVFPHDIPRQLAAYNWGIGNVFRRPRGGQLTLNAVPQETAKYIVAITEKHAEYTARG